MKELSKIHPIEIYGIWLEVVVCDNFNIACSKPERVKRLGRPNQIDITDATALAACNKRDFCIYLRRGFIQHELIAHEVFHTTIHMLDWINQMIDPNNHEHAAHLNGYLTDLVYNDLHNWKIQIK